MAEPERYPTPRDMDIAESLAHYLATQDEWSMWAYSYLSDLAEADPLRALTIIRFTLGEVDDPDQLAWFGAAQVEETAYFVGKRLAAGDREAFDELLMLAREDERMRTALAAAHAHIDGSDPPELWEAIDEILGTTHAQRHGWP